MIRTGIFSGTFVKSFLGGNGGSKQTGALGDGGSLCVDFETHESISSSSSRNGFLDVPFLSDDPLVSHAPIRLDISVNSDVPLAHLTIESFNAFIYDK